MHGQHCPASQGVEATSKQGINYEIDSHGTAASPRARAIVMISTLLITMLIDCLPSCWWRQQRLQGEVDSLLPVGPVGQLSAPALRMSIVAARECSFHAAALIGLG